MKFGVCRGLDDFSGMKAASAAGVDYWECGFGQLVNYSDEEISDSISILSENNLKLLACNGFIPGELKVAGDNIDYGKLCEYLDKGFERVKNIGVKKIVFGSGRSRTPDNDDYTKEKAMEQVAYFLSEYVSPRAKNAGCIIVMEPLRYNESGIIHTVADGVKVSEMSEADNVFGLADLYHVYGNNDDIDGFKRFNGKIKHAHIAEPVNRKYPGCFDDENAVTLYKEFIDALSLVGCDTCSVEAGTENFAEDIKKAINLLKSL
ncbi:MAG: sugar phosphate isomerase/epimerase family protein [Acutalibacteraceae bacterium]